jgi:nitroreductase
MSEILDLIQRRRSSRVPFDPNRQVPAEDLKKILSAASWSPTAHNMQNFEVVVVDDPSQLHAIGDIKSGLSEVFIRENYEQLSFSEEELRRKKTGVLAAMFPPSWRDPKMFSKLEEVAFAEGPSFMKSTIRDCTTLLFVTYDSTKRAPASDGDVLGFISLGCVMQNMWLMAEELGIGFQILSAFSSDRVENEVKKILEIPKHMKIGFTARLGYPKAESVESLKKYLRIRRDVGDFSYRNRYGIKID